MHCDFQHILVGSCDGHTINGGSMSLLRGNSHWGLKSGTFHHLPFRTKETSRMKHPQELTEVQSLYFKTPKINN